MNNEFQRDQFALRYIWNTDNQGRIGKGSESELTKFFYTKARKIGVRGLDRHAFVDDCRVEAFELVDRRWHKVSPHRQTGKDLPAVTSPAKMQNLIKAVINRDLLKIASPYVSPIQWSHKQLTRRADKLGVSNSEAVISTKSWQTDEQEISLELAGKLREAPEDKILTQQIGILANAAWTGVLTDEEYDIVIRSIVHGQRSDEIAMDLHLEPATVRQRKKRSLKKLEQATRRDPHGRALMEAIGFKGVD